MKNNKKKKANFGAAMVNNVAGSIDMSIDPRVMQQIGQQLGNQFNTDYIQQLQAEQMNLQPILPYNNTMVPQAQNGFSGGGPPVDEWGMPIYQKYMAGNQPYNQNYQLIENNQPGVVNPNLQPLTGNQLNETIVTGQAPQTQPWVNMQPGLSVQQPLQGTPIQRGDLPLPNAPMPSSASSTGSGTTTNNGQGFKNPFAGKGIPTGQWITGLTALASALAPDNANQKAIDPWQPFATNQNPYGTGSQALFEDGGTVSSSKAKEILKDGKIAKKDLTPKQKRYFGWIAGGKKAARGATVTNLGYNDTTGLTPAQLAALNIPVQYTPQPAPEPITSTPDQWAQQASPTPFTKTYRGENNAFLGPNYSGQMWADWNQISPILPGQNDPYGPAYTPIDTGGYRINTGRVQPRFEYNTGNPYFMQDGGTLYKEGDTLDLTPAQIADLRAQGYDVEYV